MTGSKRPQNRKRNPLPETTVVSVFMFITDKLKSAMYFITTLCTLFS